MMKISNEFYQEELAIIILGEFLKTVIKTFGPISILAIRTNRRQETVSVARDSLK